MEKIWNKFHPLFGPDLKVGFETTFLKQIVLDLDPLYYKNQLVHESPDEPIKRVYEPAVEVLGSCRDGEAAQVFFDPAIREGFLFRRLVFTRKIDYYTKQPRRWMVAARHGEFIHFGFDSLNSRNEKYLPLAFIGLGPDFIPLYLKIEDGDGFVYLEVWAWDDEDDGKKSIVQARRIGEAEVPALLLSAVPGLVYSI